MRILLDENLDWRLGRALPGHEVESVTRLGWAGIQNGMLLKKAQEAGFDVLLTMDSNISSAKAYRAPDQNCCVTGTEQSPRRYVSVDG